MPKLPQVSGSETISKLEKLGYKVVRQRGSHVRLKSSEKDRKPVTVPLHKVLKRGLLRAIIRDAGVSAEEFVRL